MSETTTTFKTMENGQQVVKTYSESEKALMRQYPNLGPVIWETVKNVNLVMKVFIGLFIVQAIALGLLILSQVM